MMRARTGFTVDAIFITHWHADHFLGVFGLVQTLSFMGREDPLVIYGPEWVDEFVRAIYHLSKNHLRFSLVARELHHGDTVPFEGYHVRAFRSFHGMASLGFILSEDDRPGRFNRERAVELGVPPGPLFGRLQRGETVCIITDGEERTVRPEDVLGRPRPGRKIVYTGDTRAGCEGWKDWAQAADLLLHDATFDDNERDRAKEVYHSTAGEAGSVAEELGVKTLALVHISSRYTTTANHIENAKEHFRGEVIVPDDLTLLELPYRG
jgi:ribonuclease Z